MMSANGNPLERWKCEVQCNDSSAMQGAWSHKQQNLTHNTKSRKISSVERFTSSLTERCIESFNVKEPLTLVVAAAAV